MVEAVELLHASVDRSGIKRVAIVDDVFDTPAIDHDKSGTLLDFLEKGEASRKFAAIDEALWRDAITDIRASDIDSASVAEVLQTLYSTYIRTNDKICDPGGIFDRERSANLGFLRPLLELLRSCETLEVRTYGSEAMAEGDEFLPDLILVDLYLNPYLSPTDELKDGDAQAAITKSLERVKPLLTRDPALVLMSSHGAKGREEAEKYRNKLDRVYSSRFGFVDKGHITKRADHVLAIEDPARDTLLDIFQTFKFGKALTESMSRWLTAASGGIEAMGKDVRSLQLREIAYLVQFRLAAEGQGLEEYLEWFFGEALLDYIVRGTDDEHAKNPLELEFDPSAISSIEGGFEPTKSVAKMYHSVRVESKRARARKNFRLGDLYLDKAKNRVLAVMTPDCDLVLRQSRDKLTRNAEHLLLVPGQIFDLEKTSASVGDFLMIGDIPHNIQWNYKKVFSAPFTGTMEKAGQSGEDFEYLGALRPLYAQEIQANLLNHIGRVGVAVPPVIGIPGIATIVVRTGTAFKEISARGTTFNCSLIPPRASNQPPRVVFDREVIREIRTAIINMPVDDLFAGSKEIVEALKGDNGRSIDEALRLGLEIDAKQGTEVSNGVLLTGGKRDESATAPWCAIYVKPVKVKPAVPLAAVQSPAKSAGAEIVEPIVPALPEIGFVDTDTSAAKPGSDADQPTLQ